MNKPLDNRHVFAPETLVDPFDFYADVHASGTAIQHLPCQSAFNRDPLSARKRDPLAEMLGG